MRLERDIKSEENITGRIIDIIAPIGKGQRALLVAPPKSGKTVMMQHIAHAITANHPDVTLMVLLVDERPEEVTEMQRTVRGEVIASTLTSRQHATCMWPRWSLSAPSAWSNSKRRGDLARLHHPTGARLQQRAALIGQSAHGRGRRQRPATSQTLFGAARNVEEGGSLTIIATALVDTGSRMDEVIFEEFKGTGNAEIHLDRRLYEKRVFPSIQLNRSGTRREELLLQPEILQKTRILRQFMYSMDEIESMEMVLKSMKQTKNNHEFFDMMRRGG